MPSQGNIRIYQGDDYTADITVTNTDGSPADLTGYTAQSEIRMLPGEISSPPVATFTSWIHDGNIVTISLTHEQTTEFYSPRYYWDLQLVADGTGWITTIIGGQVSVTREITPCWPAKREVVSA